MPTTYYHTLNGQILSEQTGGTRTEYAHDALGSVIATTDADRNVENTYRWAGYGTQVAKTGAGLDPHFQWAGTLGYRATGRPHAGSYIRARHYGVEQAGWTSVDPYWPGEPAYGYASRWPTRRTDPSGKDSVTRVLKRTCWDPPCPYPGPCGATRRHCDDVVRLDWDFTFDPPDFEGWLIQRITYDISVQCCGVPKVNIDIPPCGLRSTTNTGFKRVFYEAWWVKGGKVHGWSLNCDPLSDPLPDNVPADTWSVGSANFPCSHGSITTTGELALVPAGGETPIPSGLTCGGAGVCSPGQLSGTLTMTPMPTFGPGTSKKYTWSCCQGSASGFDCSCAKDAVACTTPTIT